MTVAYQSGETLRLTATITDSAGVAVNPTTVTITIENSKGIEVISAVAMTNLATGSYYYDYDIPSINIVDVGTYTYKITAIGTGGRVTIVKGSFIVDESI